MPTCCNSYIKARKRRAHKNQKKIPSFLGLEVTAAQRYKRNITPKQTLFETRYLGFDTKRADLMLVGFVSEMWRMNQDVIRRRGTCKRGMLSIKLSLEDKILNSRKKILIPQSRALARLCY